MFDISVAFISFKYIFSQICRIVQVPGPKKWLISGVSLTHLVENKDLRFLEAEKVDNIFQLDVLKNMRRIKSYAEMFQDIKGLTMQKILKIRISS